MDNEYDVSPRFNDYKESYSKRTVEYDSDDMGLYVI